MTVKTDPAHAVRVDRGPFTCGLDAAMAVIGAKWKPMIIWALESGPKRFNELRRLLPGISRKMLTQHLRELEAHGVVKRQDFHEMPLRVEYSMSPAGLRLLAVLVPLGAWADEHQALIRGNQAPD